MNWVDATLVAIFVISILTGAFDGLVKEIFGLAAAVVGVIFAARFYEVPAAYLGAWIAPPQWARIAGFFAIVLGFLIAGAIAGRIARLALKTVGAGWLDRIGGAAFGAARATVLAIAFVLILMAFPKTPVLGEVATSRLARYFAEASQVLSAVTPPELKDSFAENYEQVRRAWSELWNAKPPRLPDPVI